MRQRYSPAALAYRKAEGAVCGLLTMEGMSKTEVIRCLDRYVAREVFSILQTG